MPDTARRILKAGLGEPVDRPAQRLERGRDGLDGSAGDTREALLNNASHRSTGQRHPIRTLPGSPKAANVFVPDPQRVLSSP